MCTKYTGRKILKYHSHLSLTREGFVFMYNITKYRIGGKNLFANIKRLTIYHKSINENEICRNFSWNTGKNHWKDFMTNIPILMKYI